MRSTFPTIIITNSVQPVSLCKGMWPDKKGVFYQNNHNSISI